MTRPYERPVDDTPVEFWPTSSIRAALQSGDITVWQRIVVSAHSVFPVYEGRRDNVIGLTAVMADGRLVRTARRAKKTSAGYDLTRLLVGSEGTLGFISSITYRTVPDHAHKATALVRRR